MSVVRSFTVALLAAAAMVVPAVVASADSGTTNVAAVSDFPWH